jgi:hypothetical protein
MPAKGHALLGPSASHIWLKCPPSARLSEFIKDQETEFTKEGEAAHQLAENKLKEALSHER